MKTRNRCLQALLLAVSAAVTLSGLTPLKPAHAEGPSDPAPVVRPLQAANGKKVLFDNTHGQTAGNADWVIDGAFSDFAAALAGGGYEVKELRKTDPIALEDLQNWDVFVIPEASVPFQASEQAALLEYVKGGGSVFFIANHYNSDRSKNRWDASEVFNGYRRGAWDNPAQGMSAEERGSAAMRNVISSDWLADNFGVRFRYNAIGDAYASDIVPAEQSFGITRGVSSVVVHGASTLAVVDPEKAKGIVYLPSGVFKWENALDEGVFAGGGRDEGPLAAISKVGAGKAGFLGSVSLAEDSTPKYLQQENGRLKTTYDDFKEGDNAVLLVQMIDWLAARESYTSLSQAGSVELDQPTPLLATETPQTATEPQAEPWTLPASGYKWWDPATFKPGSYGYVPSSDSGIKASDLFFSEYIEGSGDNKALEIYNGTGHDVVLQGYTLQQSKSNLVIGLSGILKSGDVYVIAHPNAAADIKAKADTVSSILSFDGDDRIELRYDDNRIIDVVGIEDSSFARDKTLVRKGSVNGGKIVFSTAQWDSYPADTFANLGFHSVAPDNRAPEVNSPISDVQAAAGGMVTIDTANAFADPDGDPIVLTAKSNAPAVADVSVKGKALTISAASAGTAVITVTASDGIGGQETYSFFVTVTGK